MLFFARIIKLVAAAVAGVIVLGILLFVLGANQSNWFVEAVMDAGRWLVQPFDDLFTIDNRKTELAVNWGIAAAVYYLAAMLIAVLLARMSATGHTRRSARRRPGRTIARTRRPGDGGGAGARPHLTNY
jgi:hypothetical protein